ncbi:MAG: protein phosphatase 2C domain-containing protein [Deinococcus sp.]|nr:protein phosphatase 2C domain-containing protein [Deinococcus sp.]
MLDSGHTEPVSVAYLTDPGRREANQDAVGYQITPSGGVFIVADGMGGHRTGELASKLAVDTIQAQLRVGQPSPQQLVEAYERANQEVYSYGQRPESRGMGTTATTLLLDLPYALVAHVGDSRAYLFRGGELLQLTDDHSWVADRMRQGLLSPEEARHHRWRNVITNALGSLPETLNAGLPGQTGEENPPGRARTGDRLGLVLLLLLWLALLAYVLYNQYGQNGIPIQPFR